MAYNNPSVPVPPNPVFLDKAIGEIQTVLGGINWLTHSFGRSYIKVEMRSGDETRVPMVYQGSAEYLPVQFNDNLQAQSFVEVGDEFIEGEYDQFTTNYYTIPCSIIVWANLKKIDNVKGANYYFAEELKRDVRDELRNYTFIYSRLEITSISENIDAIFSNYTFTQVEKQYFSYPYVAFKFNFDLVTTEECF
jgi:hypothetical protein